MKQIASYLLAAFLLLALCPASAETEAASPLESTVLEDTAFTYYIDGTRYIFDSGMYGYARKGYLSPERVDADHDTVLKIGIEEVTPAGETSSPYVVCGAASNTNLTVRFSVFLSERADYRLALFRAAEGGGSSTEINLMRWRENLESGGRTLTYEPETWYDVQVQIDFAADAYTVLIDGETAVEQAPLESLGRIDSVRFYGNTNEALPSFMALDDLRLTTMAEPPEILEIGYDGIRNQNLLPIEAEVIEVDLSQPMYSIQKEQIHLFHEGVEVQLQQAGYDSTASMAALKPERALLPNTEYEVVIDGSAELIEGAPLGVDITDRFRTIPVTACVTEMIFSEEDGALCITARLENPEDTPQRLYLLATGWKNEQFLRLHTVQEAVAEPGMSELVFTVPLPPDGERIELYVWKDFTTPGLYADKIYIYESSKKIKF